MEQEERPKPTVHNILATKADTLTKNTKDISCSDTQGHQDVITNLSSDALHMNLQSKRPQVRIESEAIVVSTEYDSSNDHVSTIHPDLLPVNWPKHVKYLVDYEYHPSIPSSILDLVQGRRRKQTDHRSARANNATGSDLAADMSAEAEQEEEEEATCRSELEREYDDIPLGHALPGVLRTAPPPSREGTLSQEPESCPSSPPYEIQLITSPPHHPVLGSYGLFATRTLFPGLHLLDYISLVVPDEYADPDSDHTLYLSNDLNLDASVHGNHGRFVNDFRRIRTQEEGPNVGWDLYRDAETGQIRMGCKVLKRIRKGEEILCTYGKAYWKSRGVMVTGAEWEDGWDTDLEDTGEESEGGL
ncbi:hypothetical protein BGZ70_009583 [Mortierella alpina]|uniref:SET domain-containing protein n=1 Tax=Mortierella alpina TaxID=64518 RepID=A0A9P6J1K3_MORAP|nr:hypothetical protein BGZ70_009583 [Mortierella alpina]